MHNRQRLFVVAIFALVAVWLLHAQAVPQPTITTTVTGVTLVGQTLTVTAVVQNGFAGAPPAPTGTVQFRDGALNIPGSYTLTTTVTNDGTASGTWTPIVAGTHPIGTRYFGDANYGSSNPGSPNNPQVNIVIGKASTASTVVSAPPTPVTFGTAVTLNGTIVITPASATAPAIGGTANFFDGAVQLNGAPVAVVNGAASFPAGVLAPGDHNITIQFLGDSNYNPSTSPIYVLQVRAATTTTLGVLPASPSAFGQGVTLTATVASAFAGTPTGTVNFFDGASNIGSAAVTGGGPFTAVLNTSALAVGSHSFTAVYSGDTTYQTSTSSAVPYTVNKANVTYSNFVETFVPSPPVFGETLTFSVTVVPQFTGTPTGNVIFKDGATTIGTAALSGGVATINVNNLAVGTHSNVTATYQGDGNFNAGAQSAPFASFTIGQAPTKTVLGALPGSPRYGQSITLTATVCATQINPASANCVVPVAALTGTITFKDGATNLGAPVAIDANGNASLTINMTSPPFNAPAVGLHTITGVYSGDANYVTSTSPASNLAIALGTTTTSVSSTANPSVFQQSITLTATVTSAGSQGATLSGTVTFFDGATNLVTVAVSGSGATVTATLTTASLTVATHPITATYSGDANYATSTSSTLNQVVNKANTSTTLSTTQNGANLTMTATVSVLAPGGNTPTSPTGNVQFINTANNGVLATVAIAQSGAPGTNTYVATATITPGAGASLSIIATYAGDANFATSSSAINSINTQQRPSVNVVITSNVNPSAVGQAVILTATATASDGGAVTGTIQFFEGSRLLGTSPLLNGRANLTVTPPLGTHTYVAGYSGDPNYAALLASPPYTQVVATVSSGLSLTSSSPVSVFGQPVTFTAEVTPGTPAGVAAPTGQIVFRDGTTAIGVGNVNGGKVSITVSSLGVAPHQILATYAGDDSWAPATATATQTVNKAPTATALNVQPQGSTGTTVVNLTAIVTVTNPGAGNPTGSIQFIEMPGGTVLGTVPVQIVNGQVVADFSILQSSQPGGSRQIMAKYSGDLNFTNSASPTQGSLGTAIVVMNAASYATTSFARDEIISVFGDQLATTTLPATTLPLGTDMMGTSVKVKDATGVERLAKLFYISAGQVNALIPADTAPGTALITVVSPLRSDATATITITDVSPGFFSANADGSGIAAAYAIRVHADGSQTRESVAAYDPSLAKMAGLPLDLSTATDKLYIELYGTGLRHNTGLKGVTIVANGQTLTATYAGESPAFAGLDQVDFELPANFRGAGQVLITITIDGKVANVVSITTR